ncbi:MAG: hypothetical protein PHR77_22215, partial [Kiritimatiellae bacterium]|nr:hypothetical protein [Kiritimatiellia bacterium]
QKNLPDRKSEYKFNADTIYAAATQASIASLGFLHERMPDGPFTSLQPLKEPMIVVLPLIVTTADLAVCVTPPAHIDINTGLLPELELKVVDWLAFRFPFHPGTATRETDFRVVDPMQNYLLTCMGGDDSETAHYKETLYIVRSIRLSDFITQQVPKLLDLGF